MKTDRTATAKTTQAEFGYRFRVRLEEKDIKQKDLAAKIKVEPQQVNKWCSRGVPAHYAIPVGELLDISPEFISPKFAQGRMNSAPAVSHHEREQSKPTADSIGEPKKYSRYSPTPNPLSSHMASELCESLDEAEWLFAKDHSMTDLILPGDLLIIDTSVTVLTDNEVFAFRNRTNEIFTRRAIYQPLTGKWLLSSDNTDKMRYPDAQFSADEDIKVVGKVYFRGGIL